MWEYIKLLRLDKPTGIFLLFWPCAWGLAIGSSVIDDSVIFYKYLLLFFLGSFFMRSAGCVYNDIVDRKIDAKVSRTKSRPIAKGTISVTTGWMIILLLIFFSILILIQFNLNSIIFGLSSGLLVIAYPFMKRITYWPQLFLGITFNWGVILAWLVLENKISLTPLVLYSSAIFWTLGYDTIYGMQDIKDDLKIGVKSTSIKFKKKIKTFLLICYSISTSLLLLSLALLDANLFFLLCLCYLVAFYLLKFLNMRKKIQRKTLNYLH